METITNAETEKILHQLERRGLGLRVVDGELLVTIKVDESAKQRLRPFEVALIEECREALIDFLENQRIERDQATRTEADRAAKRGYDFADPDSPAADQQRDDNGDHHQHRDGGRVQQLPFANK